MINRFARFGPRPLHSFQPSSLPYLRRFVYNHHHHHRHQYACRAAPTPTFCFSSAQRLFSSQRASSQRVSSRLSPPGPSRIVDSVRGAPPRHQYRVNEMYSRGVRNVYTSPSHIGLLGFSWIVGTVCLVEVVLMATQGHWDMGDRMTGWQKTITEVGNRLGLIFFGFAGWYCLLKYRSLVKSIDLVKKTATSNALVSIKVGRFIPLMKPREVIVAASDITLPPYWLHELDDLALDSPDVRRRGIDLNLGKLLWTAFVRFRAWVFRYGIVDLTYTDNSNDKADSHTVLLDLGGDFSNRGADLWEVTSGTKSRLRS